MWGHLAARCPQAQRDRNVFPECAAISLPLREQGKDEAQRHLKVINSIRTFYEAVNYRWQNLPS
jgi:hypothetical protein